MAIKRKLRIFNNGKSRNPKPTTCFFSASLLPPPKKPKLLHSHWFFTPYQRTPWFSQTGPPLPPLLPAPHLFPPLPPLLPTPPQLRDCRRLGAPYSQSILGEVPAKLRQLAIRKRHQDIFKADKSKNNHHSGKAQFLQAAKTNTRHHAPASVSRPVKRFAYSKQELLACRLHYPQSKEIALVCARLHIILGGAGPKDQTSPPPSLDWIPDINRRKNQLGHRKRYRSQGKDAHSGNSKRFCSPPKEIGGHLSTFSAHSLHVSLKINQGKRKCTFEDKGQPLKRQKTASPGAEFLFSGFALVLLIIVGLWRLVLYNSRISRQGSLATPSPFGSSEVVPQQPSSQP